MWIQIRNHSQQDQFEHDGGTVELGRETFGQGVPHYEVRDAKVSRRQMRLTPTPGGGVELENLSTHVRLVTADGLRIRPGERCQFDMPLRVYAGDTCFDIRRDSRSVEDTHEEINLGHSSSTMLQRGSAPDIGTLVQWFGTLIGVLQSAVDPPGFYARSARALHELFGMDYGLVLQPVHGEWQIEAQHPPYDSDYSLTILSRMAVTRQTVCETFLSSRDLSESLQGVRAAVASPIFDEAGEIVAALYGARHREAHEAGGSDIITPIERQLVQLLATAVSSGVARLESRAKMERLQTEMELAQRIQQGLFPRRMPEVEGYEFFGRSEPAAVTGGDYYDALPLDGERVGLAVADVCGHGLGPSLLMASMRATLRGLAVRQHDAAQLLSDLNSSMYEELRRRMITVLYGVLDVRGHQFSYANAGHGPAVLHVRAGDGSLRLLHEDDNRNLPIGAIPLLQYENCAAVALEPGDLIVLGSDGLVERNESFGVQQFCDLLVERRRDGLAEIYDRVIARVQEDSASPKRDDDLTLLLARRV